MERRTNAEIAAQDFAPDMHLCAGVPWLTIEERERAAKLRESLVVTGDVEAMRYRLDGLNKVIGRKAGITGGYYPLDPDAGLPELRKRFIEIGNGRKPCRYDLGKLKAKEPFDGQEHTVTCPACGNVTSWVPPLSAENVAAVDAATQGALEKALTL